jgi:type VI protein secretion system component VasK
MPFAGVSWWESIIVLLLMFGLPIGIIWVIVQWVKFFQQKEREKRSRHSQRKLRQRRDKQGRAERDQGKNLR